MKRTRTETTAKGIKVTHTHTIDADGIQRLTLTASVKKNGKLFLAQKVKVNTGEGYKTLYTRTQNGKGWRIWLNALTWIRLGMYLDTYEIPEETA